MVCELFLQLLVSFLAPNWMNIKVPCIWPLTMQELTIHTKWDGVPPNLGDARVAKLRFVRPLLAESSLAFHFLRWFFCHSLPLRFVFSFFSFSLLWKFYFPFFFYTTVNQLCLLRFIDFFFLWCSLIFNSNFFLRWFLFFPLLFITRQFKTFISEDLFFLLF